MTIECPKCRTDNPDTQNFCGDCGTQLEADVVHTKTLETPIEELTTGSTFAGRYQIIEELGKGGMGKVYRVLDKKLNEEVALKLIKPDIAADKKTIERFKNELKLARKIRQKNVGSMYELMEEQGKHFITMEYISGQDLKGLIRQTGQLTVGKALFIAKQICEGLAEAHNQGVVHRDLKPNNIMIDRGGNARIMDFGIARAVKEKSITGSGVMIGTPEYMSPEQVEGKEVDQRSDIYSLGVILYEMVTGTIPFEGETPFNVGMKHKSEVPKDPKELNAQIPDDLNRTILKCLEKEEVDRYQSAIEVRSELAKIEKGIPTTERVARKRESKTVNIGEIKWRSIILYSGVAILLILLIVGRRIFFTRHHEAIDSIAVLPMKNQSGDPGQEYFVDGMTEALIAELSKISSLSVTSRQSIMRYKGSIKSLPEIAKDLGIDAVVDGSVFLIGDRVRISTHLIEAKKDRYLWTKTYDRNIRDVLALYSEVARAIADEVKIVLTPEEEIRFQSSYAVNPEAYDAYLMGRHYLRQAHKEGLRKSIDYFKEACEKDSTFALGYAGIAEAYAWLASGAVLPPKETWPEVRLAAEKALEVDERLSEAHFILAWVKFQYEFEWIGGEKEFQQALTSNPNNADARNVYSWLLTALGRHDEAVAQIKLAKRLDPLSLTIQFNEGWVLAAAGRYDEAQHILKNLIDSYPESPWGHVLLAKSYAYQGMHEKAVISLETGINLLGDNSIDEIPLLGYLYGRLERRMDALRMLEKLDEIAAKGRYVSPVSKSWIYIGIDEMDAAFELLEMGYETRSNWMPYLKIDFVYDRLIDDPRFKDLLQRMNLN